MRGNIFADYRAGFDHGAFANPYVRQDDAMRSDEDILVDNDCALVLITARPPVKMGKNSGAQPDGAVVSDGDAIGMAVIDVDEMREPDMLTDVDTTQAMEPRPQTASARTNESENVKATTPQIGEHGITFRANEERFKTFGLRKNVSLVIACNHVIRITLRPESLGRSESLSKNKMLDTGLGTLRHRTLPRTAIESMMG